MRGNDKIKPGYKKDGVSFYFVPEDAGRGRLLSRYDKNQGAWELLQHRQFWQFLSEGSTGQRRESSTWEEKEDRSQSWRLQCCFQQRVFGVRVQRTDFPEHPECMRHRVMKDPITSEQAFQQTKEKHYTEHIEQTHG